MHNHRQRVHRFAVQQNIQPHQVGFAVINGRVVHGSVALGGGFQPVEEIVHNFRERQFIGQHHAVHGQIVQILLETALFFAQLHDIAHIFIGHMDIHLHIRFIQRADAGGVRQFGGVVHFLRVAVRGVHLINDRRRRGDEADLKFAFQPLLNNFHMQQAQKAAAEAEAQGLRGFRLIGKRGIVQAQFFQGHLEVFVIIGFRGVQAAKNHGLHGLEAGHGFAGGVFRQSDGVPHLRIAQFLDAAAQKAHFAGGKLLHVHRFR